MSCLNVSRMESPLAISTFLCVMKKQPFPSIERSSSFQLLRSISPSFLCYKPGETACYGNRYVALIFFRFFLTSANFFAPEMSSFVTRARKALLLSSRLNLCEMEEIGELLILEVDADR